MKLLVDSRTRILFAVLCCCLYAPAAFAQAGSAPQVQQAVVAGGGGTSSDPNLKVDGTAGQSVTGTSSAGTYTLSSGFWPGTAPLVSGISVNDVSATFGDSVTLTAKLTSSGGNVDNKLITFTLNGTTAGTATTDAGGVATLVNVSLAGVNAATYPAAIAAQFAGDASLLACSGSGQLTVGKASPQLQVMGGTFNYDGQPHPAAASATGVNNVPLTPVTLLYNGAASVPVNAGTYAVTASFAGDMNYNPVANSQQSIIINLAGQTITFGALAQKTFGDADFTVSATASSGLPVSFAAAGDCTVSGATVHITGAGSCTITASQSGDSNYSAAADVQNSFQTAKGSQMITFAPLADTTFGDADFVVNASASSGLPVSFAATGQCTVSGSSVHLNGANSCTITASQTGDSNYNAAADVQRSFQIARGSQTITFAPLADKTFGDADFAITASASSGLPVSFAATGQCTVSGSTVHLNGASSCTITASQSGDPNYHAATDVQRSFQIARGSQTITFAPLADKTFGDADFAITASASSGLPVSFAATGQCTVSGNTVHLNGANSCTITASQPGDSNYNAATDVQRSFQIAKGSQTITFAPLADKTFGDADFAVTASASSGLPVSFTATGQCTVSGSNVHLNGANSCTITASQPGDFNYNAATDVQRSFQIARGSQTITFAPLANKTFGDADFAVTASASSGLPVSFTANGQCAISGNTVHLNGANSCTITASQPGDFNYNAAADVQRSFQIGKGSQTISFAALTDKTFGVSDFAINATASSGLSVSFTVSGSCLLLGSSVHINAVGNCTITASQDGDSNFNAATAVAQSFQIAKAATATALSAAVSQTEVGQVASITATITSAAGTPTGAVQFKADGADLGSPVALGAGGAATLTTPGLSAGAHTITADYLGDVNFNGSTGTLPGVLAVGGVIEFSQSLYSVGERDGSVTISVRRTGDTTGALTVDYVTDDGRIPSVLVPCSAVTGLALERCDYTRAAGSLHFAAGEAEKTFTVLVTDDSYAEGVETLQLVLANPAGGAALGQQSAATLQILDDAQESAGNPIDEDRDFVIQHYHDFLNREPDDAGLQFWTNEIKSCGADLQCREVKRVNVSAAFFLSIEFQQTGYLVERMYKTAFGDATGNSTFPAAHQLAIPAVRLQELLRDTQEIGGGVAVLQGDWETQLENNKNAFALGFVSRQRFAAALPPTLNAAQFVTQLDQNAGGVLSDADKAQLEAVFGGPAAITTDVSKRAQVLRAVAENATLQQREFNRAFVLMQYFGYLRRNPDDAQDTDYTGYDFWLTKLNQFNGNFIHAEMVKGFISSIEYRQRFGR